MDALRNIITNVPDWLKRLDELSSQIDQRQVELAALSETASAASRSLKHKGSTESLKPKDDGDAFLSSPPGPPQTDVPMSGVDDAVPQPENQRAVTPPANPPPADSPAPISPGGCPINGAPATTPSALQRQTQQAMAVAQKRARAQVRKRHRTESIISAEGAMPKFHSRSMIIVYYDSYVQGFFEELVKFVSASRNLMRKAKMAAKVAQIKRLAELEMPDEEDEDEQDDSEKMGGVGGDLLAAMPPSKLSIGARRPPPVLRGALPSFALAGGRGLLGDQGPDAYDDIDKGLEYVQSMSEHAAHQFLRDGDCSEEIANVQRRLAETRELAAKEMERVERDEPELLAAQAADGAGKARMHRPTSMRRDATPKRELRSTDKVAPAAVTPVAPLAADDGGMGKLEVDPVLEADEGVEDMDMPMPVLTYKSTRNMRYGPPR